MNIKLKTREDLELILYKLSCNYADISRTYADKQAAFDRLDGQKKVYFASVIDRFTGSFAERERNALLDNSWIIWDGEYIEAKETALKAKVERDIVFNKWDTCKQILISRMKKEC